MRESGQLDPSFTWDQRIQKEPHTSAQNFADAMVGLISVLEDKLQHTRYKG